MKQIAIDRDQYSGSDGQERHQNIVSHRALEKWAVWSFSISCSSALVPVRRGIFIIWKEVA